MRIDSYNSLKDYLNFASAKEFIYVDNMQNFPASIAERITSGILMPIQQPVDYFLKNCNQPMIIGAYIVGMTSITLFFYPDICFQTVRLILSPFMEVQPWMLKKACFLLGETMITALMIRTLARCHKRSNLLVAWETKKIVPVHLGMRFMTLGK